MFQYSDDYVAGIEAVIRPLEVRLSPGSKTERERKQKAGEYDFIPYGIESFTHILKTASLVFSFLNEKYCVHTEPESRSFSFNKNHTGTIRPTLLDVGAGIGTKVLTAENLGFHAYGVEITRSYVKKAEIFNIESSKHTRLPPPPKFRIGPPISDVSSPHIFHSDALKFNYAGFDVIYLYEPFVDPTGMLKLGRRIFETSSENTIFIGRSSIIDNFPKYGIESKMRKLQKEFDIKSVSNDIWPHLECHIKMKDKKKYRSLQKWLKAPYTEIEFGEGI